MGFRLAASYTRGEVIKREENVTHVRFKTVVLTNNNRGDRND